MDFFGRKTIDGLDYADFYLLLQRAFGVRTALGSPLAPQSALTGTIYFDPQASVVSSASDSSPPIVTPTINSPGVTAVAGPVFKTFAGIAAAYGTISPYFSGVGNGVKIIQLSSQPAGQDFIFFRPNLSNGAQAVLLGNLIPVSSNWVAGTVTAQVRGAPGTRWQVAGTPVGTAAKQILYNVTRNSFAVIDTMAVQVATVSQPMPASSLAPPTAVPGTPPAVDNTWATGDTFTTFTAPLCNLRKWSPVGADFSNGAVPSAGWVEFIELATDSASATTYPFEADGINGITCCVVDTRMSLAVKAIRGNGLYLLGNFHVGGITAISGAIVQIAGGIINAGLTVFPAAGVIVDDDCVLHGAVNIDNYLATVTGIFWDGTLTLAANKAATIKAAGVFWGSGNLTLNPNSNFLSAGNTFANNLQTTGALKFGTQTTGSKYQGAGVFVDGVALSSANIDTGGTGGTGLQDPLTGARFSLTQ